MNRYLRKGLAISGQLAKYFCFAHCTFTYVGNLVLVSKIEDYFIISRKMKNYQILLSSAPDPRWSPPCTQTTS